MDYKSKTPILLVALSGLCTGGCMTMQGHTSFYPGSPNTELQAVKDRTWQVSSADNAVAQVTDPTSGKTVLLNSGNNSNGQGELRRTILGVNRDNKLAEVIKGQQGVERAKDAGEVSVAREGTQADSAAEAGRQATEQAEIGAETTRVLSQ